MRLSILYLIPFAFGCIEAASINTPLPPTYVVHERRGDHLEWKPTRRAEGHVLVPLRIGLKQKNLESIPEYLSSVSDPTSAEYGRHWTPKNVVEMFSPSPLTKEAVYIWLAGEGIDSGRLSMSHNKGWIDVQGATVDEVERLLQTEYHVFEQENGEEHVACHSYHLPIDVVEHVDFVVPTVQPNIRILQSNAVPHSSAKGKTLRQRQIKNPNQTNETNNPLAGCDTAVTPTCLKALYNMTYVPKTTDRNTFGIVSNYPNIYLQSDLDTFFGNFSPASVGKSPTLVSIDGGSLEVDELSSFGETGWILEYAMTFVEPQPIMLLEVGNKETGQFVSFNQWLDAVDVSYCTSDGGDDLTYDPLILPPFSTVQHSCGIIRPPNVVSNSQADHENQYSEFYRQRQCNEFAKLGLMGVTVLYSAGNAGTAGAQSGMCLDQNGSMNLNATNFNPAWPASCPWVTAVGGTQVKANATLRSSSAEEVWNQDMTMGFFESGGGGFSNQFSTPDYQKSAVDKYMQFLRKTSPETLKHFNAKGRAYPDLSANANMFVNIDNGTLVVSSGTSGSVPTVASIISLVNDARIVAGKKPVGFINPVIYSTGFASAFNDIVSGANQGCRGLQGVRDGGFKTTEGWDPASGVGSPNLGRLIEKWMSLP